MAEDTPTSIAAQLREEDVERVAYAIEPLLISRIYAGRVEGYTIEASQEFARAAIEAWDTRSAREGERASARELLRDALPYVERAADGFLNNEAEHALIARIEAALASPPDGEEGR